VIAAGLPQEQVPAIVKVLFQGGDFLAAVGPALLERPEDHAVSHQQRQPGGRGDQQYFLAVFSFHWPALPIEK
jgi:hypothetical protein